MSNLLAELLRRVAQRRVMARLAGVMATFVMLALAALIATSTVPIHGPPLVATHMGVLGHVVAVAAAIITFYAFTHTQFTGGILDEVAKSAAYIPSLGRPVARVRALYAVHSTFSRNNLSLVLVTLRCRAAANIRRNTALLGEVVAMTIGKVLECRSPLAA